MRFFQKPDSRILAKPEVHLTIAGVDGNHLHAAPCCSRQSVKPPVDAPTSRQVFPVDVDLPVIECALQLESAPADVLQIFAEQADHALSGDLRAGLLDLLVVHQNLARENQSVRPLARCGQPTIHKKFVESDFHNLSLSREFYHESASPRSSAKC